MICDLHTHTAYCDGDNTPEEMLLSAIEKGFNTYGFSSHSHLSYDESWNMSHAEQKKYVAEVLSLREKYKGKIGYLRDKYGMIHFFGTGTTNFYTL